MAPNVASHKIQVFNFSFFWIYECGKRGGPGVRRQDDYYIKILKYWERGEQRVRRHDDYIKCLK